MIKSSEERKMEKQQQIQTLVFDTTTQLMKRYKFDEITIRMICAEANISIGMFYRNFSGKTEILSYFYQKALNEQIQKTMRLHLFLIRFFRMRLISRNILCLKIVRSSISHMISWY